VASSESDHAAVCVPAGATQMNGGNSSLILETIPKPIVELSQAASRSPVRVLHVLEATAGGTMLYLDNIITATAGLPFQFGFAYSTLRATPALDAALEKARARGWQTFQLEMPRKLLLPQDIRSIFQLAKLYWEFKPDIVHCHSSKAGALGRIAGLAKPFHRPRVVYAPHSVAVHLGKHYLLAERALAPLTARTVAVSESEGKELVSLKLTSPGNYIVVNPVVDCKQFAPRDRDQARDALGLPLKEPIIVGIGRMAAQKNPLAFVSILSRVLEETPEAHGIWVGDGELRPEFLEAARQHGIEERVTVTGWQDDVRPWLAAADLLLSTSEYESFGYMVGEALAMERAVVATNITGTCDIMVEDLAAFLYSRGDEVRAAELIFTLLRSPLLSSQCGRIGRQMVAERFSFETMRNSLEALYSQL